MPLVMRRWPVSDLTADGFAGSKMVDFGHEAAVGSAMAPGRHRDHDGLQRAGIGSSREARRRLADPPSGRVRRPRLRGQLPQVQPHRLRHRGLRGPD
jgi:hypothetical protein